MTTRQQQFAAAAFNRVNGVLQIPDFDKDRYGSIAHRLPVLIRSAGLAQALAYVEARGKSEGERLLDDLASVVGYTNRVNLLTQARTSQLLEYMHLTDQCLDALLWFKRFAQTVLDVDAASENNND